jgi:RNA polymerase sigma factor (TIGR02999 family)
LIPPNQYARIPLVHLSTYFGKLRHKVMTVEKRGDLTGLLDEIRAGNSEGKARLVVAIYSELRRMAGRLMKHERPDHTLQPSALVNETLLKLFRDDRLGELPNRGYLFRAAAQAMRQVLVDHARKRRASKRPGRLVRTPLDGALAVFDERRLDVLAVHEALERLAQKHSRQAQVVELRFFGGFSVPEVAETLGVSTTTVESDWRFARAWLQVRLGGLADGTENG